MPRYHVLLSHYPGYEPYDYEKAELSARDAELTIIEGDTDTVSDDLLHRCDVLLNISWRVSAELMDQMPRCCLVTVYGIGTDSVDLAAATKRGIVVSNIPLAAVDDVANHAIALLLSSLRRVVPLDAAIRRGVYDWTPLIPAHNPRGKVLGLVAFGNIARAVARKMQAAFGMQVTAYDPYVAPETGREYNVRLTTLDEVLRTSDFVSVHAPLTPETRGLIGEAQLRLMKPAAHLVVTSRGGVVDEATLAKSLREGWIAGAALDVQAHEPVPPGDPLLDAPNLILTPHCAGYSEESTAEIKRLACDAACRVLEGRWPRWVVNKGVEPRVALAEVSP
ncbi:MAG: C-terminal binding protein [Anaerolineae bacterium]|nr:C-terminal binding protein [Anaerolineae bacterium]